MSYQDKHDHNNTNDDTERIETEAELTDDDLDDVAGGWQGDWEGEETAPPLW